MKRPIILPFLAAAMTIPAFGGEPAGLLQKFLDTSTAYRLSAWVKTKGLADGGACLEVSGWRENNQRFTSRSESKLAGDHDWTPLQITFGPMSGGMGIRLCAEGTGTAWFDDVELVELPR